MNEKEIKKYEDKLKDKLKIVNKGTPTKMLQPGLNDSPK